MTMNSYDNSVNNAIRHSLNSANILVTSGHLREAIKILDHTLRIHTQGSQVEYADPYLVREVRRSRIDCYIKLNMTDEADKELRFLIQNPIIAVPAKRRSGFSSVIRRLVPFRHRTARVDVKG